MRSIKKLSLFFLIFVFNILLLKSIDIAVGYFFNHTTSSGLRLGGERHIILKEFPPNQEATLTPNSIYMSQTQGLTQTAYTVKTDQNGFIDNLNSIDKFSSQQSIIFFGGSTTSTLYVKERNRFPSIVERSLVDEEGINIRTLNSGVDGNHAFHSLLALLGKGIPQNPSHIVLMNTVNDVGTLMKTLSYWNAPHTRAVIQIKSGDSISMYSVARYIKNLLVPNLYLAIKPLLSEKPIEDEWEGFRDKNSSAQEIFKALDTQYKATLESFILISRAWGIEPILMTQFNRIEVNDEFVRKRFEKAANAISFEEFHDLFGHANKIVRVIAKKHGVHLIDLDKLIPKNSTYIYDAIHLNDSGSLLVAKIIIKELITVFPEKMYKIGEKGLQ
jgi:hypothetical protein